MSSACANWTKLPADSDSGYGLNVSLMERASLLCFLMMVSLKPEPERLRAAWSHIRTVSVALRAEHQRALENVLPAALEAGPRPFPPPKPGCLMAALSSARAVLRALARTSSSCPRRAWTESNSVWRACTFSELQSTKKKKKKIKETSFEKTGPASFCCGNRHKGF